ncbi:hypothetical protein Val02_44890 [Virgisporangium aliadipatigenens]|uniref:DUF475 domain-containing protein n=1 Tax=Virgisporangium aliadipatigenens TaxID=741659 RepID=A0A8J3YPT8_9ACTN|nr:DUF475 domain-containing protein [Virgisporangium aliadipatigenens]GIJ47603.1 hypothetical protein Val02_44890 [Virgisporangium aliadipatigenens]
MSILRTFFWSFVVTAAGLAGGFWYGGATRDPGTTFVSAGLTALFLVAILTILEISFSFDNAVINATILRRMSKFWQTIFLTVGVLIAVFGMRLVFPFLLVSASAGISPWEAVELAVNPDSQDEFARLLVEAHPTIAAFGGIFLLMIFLDFVFEDHDFVWLRWIEKPLAKIGKLDQLSVVIALAVIAAAGEFLAPDEERSRVLLAGVLGLLTYLLVNGLSELFDVDEEDEDDEVDSDAEAVVADAKEVEKGNMSPGRAAGKLVVVTGRAAFFLFLYLEVLDASFSFDGVVGAFAITLDPIVIAIGLGVGAMYVRSLTVFLVNRGTLDSYVYLEHGAHWAIGVLAVILVLTIEFHIPEWFTGLIGVAFIALSVWSSVRRNKKVAAGELDADSDNANDEDEKELAKV